MIKIKNVSYTYPSLDGDSEGKTALDDISIDINKGDFVAILGHNGSGKSTLGKLLNAQIKPSKGEILVDDISSSQEGSEWDIRKKCSMVFQNPDNQMVATIVEEDVAFGPENMGIPLPELRERVDKALERVGMLKYKKHAPHMLSGGQKQRVAIAGVLAMKPDIIVFDEPTAMLDPTGRKSVMRSAIYLNKEEGKTVINITHFMDEAVLSDRVIVMSKGKVVLEGTPKEVFSQVDLVKKLQLDVPQVTELAFLLRQNGIEIDEGILDVDELVNSL